MADSVTTGSTVYGLVNGLDHGILPSGTKAGIKPQIIYVAYNPNNVVTSITGSDIAYCFGDGNFYIGDITRGAAGSEWCRLGSLT